MTMIDDHGHITMAKTRSILAGEFKARCLKLMDEVNETGEEIVVKKRGKPVVELVPLQPLGCRGKVFFGAMKGTATIHSDIIGPFFDDWAMKED
jgi:prevent-host-death family protein